MGANKSVMPREDNDDPTPTCGMRKAPEKVVEFNSRVGAGVGAGYRVLSNFCAVPGGIKWKGRMYPSSEHIYQMELKADPSCWHMFECGGVLGSLESGFEAMGYKGDELQKKLKAWGPLKSGRPCMVGIVAKMGINRPEKVAGLKLKPKPEDDFDEQQLIEIFLPILKAKWRDFREYRVALKAVPKDAVLVEFSGRAEFETKQGRPPRWTGHVSGGVLYGQNLGGRLMDMVRAEMIDEE